MTAGRRVARLRGTALVDAVLVFAAGAALVAGSTAVAVVATAATAPGAGTPPARAVVPDTSAPRAVEVTRVTKAEEDVDTTTGVAARRAAPGDRAASDVPAVQRPALRHPHRSAPTGGTVVQFVVVVASPPPS